MPVVSLSYSVPSQRLISFHYVAMAAWPPTTVYRFPVALSLVHLRTYLHSPSFYTPVNQSHFRPGTIPILLLDIKRLYLVFHHA